MEKFDRENIDYHLVVSQFADYLGNPEKHFKNGIKEEINDGNKISHKISDPISETYLSYNVGNKETDVLREDSQGGKPKIYKVLFKEKYVYDESKSLHYGGTYDEEPLGSTRAWASYLGILGEDIEPTIDFEKIYYCGVIYDEGTEKDYDDTVTTKSKDYFEKKKKKKV